MRGAIRVRAIRRGALCLASAILVLVLTGCSGMLDAGAPRSEPSPSGTPSGAPAAGSATPTDASQAPTAPRSTQPGWISAAAPAYLCEPISIDDTAFASGRAELTSTSQGLLDAAAHIAELRRLGVPATLTIVGHTDHIPTRYPGGNPGLSTDRALAVRDALVFIGVDPAWITETVGVAASQPIASGDDPASLARNRRVEVTFRCP